MIKKRMIEQVKQEKNVLLQLNHPFIVKMFFSKQSESTVDLFMAVSYTHLTLPTILLV